MLPLHIFVVLRLPLVHSSGCLSVPMPLGSAAGESPHDLNDGHLSLEKRYLGAVWRRLAEMPGKPARWHFFGVQAQHALRGPILHIGPTWLQHSALCTAGNECRAAAPLIRSGLAKTSRGHICIFLLRSAHRSR